MRTPRLFFDGKLAVGSKLTLTKEQAHYLGRVLRLKPNRQLVLFNGTGGEYQCNLSSLDAKQGSVEVLAFFETEVESPLNICLAIGLSKGDRFDWAIQKATELGVSSIQPLFTERTEVRLSQERLAKKAAHWQGIVRSACEQSGRTMLPQVFPATSLRDFCTADSCELKLILNPEEKRSLATLSTEKPLQTLSLLVGPEGGLSREEIGLAALEGYESVSLGPRILRTETAPIAALAVLQSKYGDW